MKKQLLLAGTLLGLFQAQAQQRIPFKTPNAGHKNQQMIQRILGGQSDNKIAHKPTTIQQRVIAQNDAYGFTSEDDSTTFKYTGTKSSVFDFNNPDYQYNTYFSNQYAPIFLYPDEIHPINMLADSITRYYDDELSSAAKAYYRTDNKIDSSYNVYNSGLGGNSTSKQINIFNPQGYLIKSYGLNKLPVALTFDTISINTYSYNAGFTRIVTDSSWFGISSLPELRETIKYHYNSGNQLDSLVYWDLQGSAPERSQSYLFTYYTNGKLRTMINEEYYDGNTVIYSKDSFGYSTGVDYVTFRQSIYYEDGDFYESYREIKYPDANGLVDSSIAYGQETENGPWILYGKLQATYNEFDNPTSFVVVDGDGDLLRKQNFYYETFDDGISSVKSLADNKTFQVFPNPFTGNISIDWKQAGEKNLVRMVNMLGQEVYNSSIKLNPGKNEIMLPAISAGNYVLLIQTADGKTWSNKMIKK